MAGGRSLSAESWCWYLEVASLIYCLFGQLSPLGVFVSVFCKGISGSELVDGGAGLDSGTPSVFRLPLVVLGVALGASEMTFPIASGLVPPDMSVLEGLGLIALGGGPASESEKDFSGALFEGPCSVSAWSGLVPEVLVTGLSVRSVSLKGT